jgi:hypothetical protein
LKEKPETRNLPIGSANTKYLLLEKANTKYLPKGIIKTRNLKIDKSKEKENMMRNLK